ncbi:hypothetical protein [Pararhizobium sp. DWP1-1-3]|uniref:hypothetical protein n=1 Tax=Pararhizobium sp. DWP1-1-3 TaxID=2804652 RepID=UPI003CF38BCE
MHRAAPDPQAVSRAIDALTRTDRGRLLSALIARLKNFQLAEDALQDALASAVVHWGRTGLPASPQGWLLKVALRKATVAQGRPRRPQDRRDRAAVAGRSGRRRHRRHSG